MALGQVLVGRSHRRYQDAASLQHPEGTGLHLAANKIDHRIDASGFVFEASGPVVDHLVGTEAQDVGLVLRARCGDHAAPRAACELHRIAADIARRAMDQHRLTAREVGLLEECLLGRDRHHGHRRGVDVG
jgi:hypothetical protein